MKKYMFIILVAMAVMATGCAKKSVDVVSPDGALSISVDIADTLRLSVSYRNAVVVSSSTIALVTEDAALGVDARVRNTVSRSVRESIEPPYGKATSLADHYNETRINFHGDWSLVVRAYDEGVAYRFTTGKEGELIVLDEIAEIDVEGDPAVIYQETDSYTSWEVMHMHYNNASAIAPGKRAVTPVLFSRTDGIKVVVAESDVRDYPGMYLEKRDDRFVSDFAPYPDSTALGSWGFVSVVQRARPYIAKTIGNREFPWRVVMVTDDDRELLTNELIYKLATPNTLDDLSWIKPGKAAWEWWHDAMLPGADIPSGTRNKNTELYKHYIDFAAEYGLEYLMIDAGWSHIFDLSQVNDKVDVREIIDYGKTKNVGIFLWCTAMALTDRADEFLKMMCDWGAVGIKVDFFDRDDQLAMQWYEDVARKAAENRLMVNFHGCSKPTGMQRMYPNIVNYEAVRGAECSKWDLTADPEHHVTFPFTRMLGGPVDYTPGAMRNTSPQLFKPVDPGLPSGQGTRCHELAMYVVYDQYFAMLCDSPSAYRKEPDAMRFLSGVPVVFDETTVIDARVGDYIVTAKRKDHEWWVGAMTDWTARRIEIDLSFLEPDMEYVAEIYKDGYDAGLWASRYVFETRSVGRSTVIPALLAQGGGFAMRIYPR